MLNTTERPTLFSSETPAFPAILAPQLVQTTALIFTSVPQFEQNIASLPLDLAEHMKYNYYVTYVNRKDFI